VSLTGAHSLYLQLKAACPDFFCPVRNFSPIHISEGSDAYFEDGTITFKEARPFRRERDTTILPLHSIRSCYQLYDSDPESFYCCLVLRMENGAEHKFQIYSDSLAFQLARRLKALNPDLCYLFPQEN